MATDYNKFYERRLWAARIGTEITTWIGIGFLYGFIADLIPEPSCPISSAYGEMDAEDLRRMTCMGAYYMRIPPIIWLVFTGLRVFFFVSSRQADPLLSLESLKVEKADGRPLTLANAALYAFLEWLPVHLSSLYILIFGTDITIFTFFGISTLTLTAQILWLIPFRTKQGKRTIPDTLTNLQVVFTEEGKFKIEERFQKKIYRTLDTVFVYTGRLLCITFIFLFTLLSVQILRTPEINTDVERLIYSSKEPVWHDNAYFAITGLNAPADSSDSVAYGRAVAIRNFKTYEDIKAFARIPHTYPLPPQTPDLPTLHKDQEISITNEGWKDLYCLVSPIMGPTYKQCATENDLQSYIGANRLIWDRFNDLPEDTPYHAFPGSDTTHAKEFRILALMKSAHIVVMANKGQSEEAFNHWYKYMKLYRSMAGAHETAYFKASIRLVIAYHTNVLREILYLYPDLAKSHYNQINIALESADETIFREDRVLSDEMAMMEPWILAYTGNVNAIRNDVYECLTIFGRIAKLPAHEFPYGTLDEGFCSFSKERSNHWQYALTQPGFFLSNLIAELMYRDIVEGSSISFPESAKLQDARIRMTLLGTEILNKGITAENIPEFIASVPSKLHNPITSKPFDWDAATKSLYLVNPAAGTRLEFILNL